MKDKRMLAKFVWRPGDIKIEKRGDEVKPQWTKFGKAKKVN